jgi:hypothetical protein
MQSGVYPAGQTCFFIDSQNRLKYNFKHIKSFPYLNKKEKELKLGLEGYCIQLEEIICEISFGVYKQEIWRFI